MSHTKNPLTREDEEAQIRRNLNRSYWIFMLVCLLFAVYCLGWWQGYTSL